MNGQKGHRPGGLQLGLAFALALATVPGLSLAVVSVEGRPTDSWSAAGVRLAWRVSLPLRSVDHIRQWTLVDEYLYALGTDGSVRAVRADTGEHLWTQPMVDPLADMFPPVSYETGEIRGVAFTVRDQVLFLDPATGETLLRPKISKAGKTEILPVGPFRMWAGSAASIAAYDDLVFQPAPRKRVRQYDLVRGIQTSQVSIHAEITLAPLYLPQRELLVVADEDGTVVGVTGPKLGSVFNVKLKSRPTGWLAVDDDAVYVVTQEPRLHVLDLNSGEERLEGFPQGYLLSAMPVGGPVVTEDSVFVVLEGRGLQRVGKELKWPNWLAGDVRRFLAEWPDRLALQRNDGKIVFVRPQTGEVLAVIDPGQGYEGLSNSLNDEIILTTARGDMRCLRPVDSAPLKPADFRPVASQPASAPAGALAATTRPATATKPAEAEKSAEEKAAGTENAATPAAETGPKLSPVEALIADPLKSHR